MPSIFSRKSSRMASMDSSNYADSTYADFESVYSYDIKEDARQHFTTTTMDSKSKSSSSSSGRITPEELAKYQKKIPRWLVFASSFGNLHLIHSRTATAQISSAQLGSGPETNNPSFLKPDSGKKLASQD
ncbi:uncharacterized protein B0I36DRAFT_358430 [Microdochium trichocladiopsis]|uniref:Uncharacterized protein n=1 Tax=Microdochium trichocladiopsis TaxID=1682393 RepID=A0A9P8YJR7_9PEZI|nr:uncharacterized protein B0I36DRAFT_358430 [Microdochium trichocladiopsis]KAH7041242.1 hypothetical protein B0I36DRAFT_358430 [Microdochium trichocladiopsis]